MGAGIYFECEMVYVLLNECQNFSKSCIYILPFTSHKDLEGRCYYDPYFTEGLN